jgi:hypothetical protein
MATVEKRYLDAVTYIERAIATVEKQSSWNPVTRLIEGYASDTKVENARNELRHVQDRWQRATSETERARVARDAEMLADRTQENLPGAPQDRQRTNLYKGETPKSTPATHYGEEAKAQTAHAIQWVQTKARNVRQKLEEPWRIGTWLLIGGGVVLAVSLLRSDEREQRQSSARALNRRLAQVANRNEDGDPS